MSNTPWIIQCAACAGKGEREFPGFTGRSVLRTCDVCKGKGTLHDKDMHIEVLEKEIESLKKVAQEVSSFALRRDETATRLSHEVESLREQNEILDRQSGAERMGR